MEEMYWKHFMETGNVTDYLDYKMEVYGHGGGVDKRQKRMENSGIESDRIDRNGASDGADWRI